MKKLTDLAEGESALVESIEEQGVYQKLLDIGIIPGEYISLEKKAPLGDPILVKINNQTICIRKKEAACVVVS